MSKYTKMDNLPLTMFAGEQATIPPILTLSTDKELLANIEADTRTDKFIYAYTDSGVSANERNWKPEIMTSISEQVIAKLPVGYLGHIKPSEYGYEFPDPQVVWFGSLIEELTVDKTKFNRLWLKGYLLPTATKLETWIKSKAVNSISVYGKITYVDVNGVQDITAIDLKSIDISRKLGEGLNSKIVSLASEMDIAYEDVRNKIESTIKDKVKSSMPVTYHTDGSPNNPYVYVYLKTLYVNKNTGICKVENDSSKELDRNSCYKFDYTINDKNGDVTVGDLVEVIKEVEYKVKENGTSIKEGKNGIVSVLESEPVNKSPNQIKGEMNLGGNVMERNEFLKSLTIEEIMIHNPGFVTTLKTAIANEMSNENTQKSTLLKSQKVDTLVTLVGGEQEQIVETVNSILTNNKNLMKGLTVALFGGESDEAKATEVSAEKVIAKANAVVKDNVDQKAELDKVAEVVGKTKEETLVDAAQKVVAANKLSRNTTWIKNVNDKFVALASGVDGKNPVNETILSFVRDDFDAILDMKPEEISEEDWEANALKYMEASFTDSVAKYTKRLGDVVAKSKSVGEMNAFEKLGSKLGGEQSKVTETEDEDEDVAYAKSLGY